VKKKQKAPKRQTASNQIQSSRVNTSTTENNSKWIRINKPFPLPPHVKEAIQKLNEAGQIAYIVGGSVRDFLLNRESKDHDIATSAGPEELCRLFPDAVTVGKSFGVLKIPIRDEHGPQFFEIATFRKDLEYKDFRHPTKVLFTGVIEDALRRDFTVNALYYDPKTSRILDPVEGSEDIKNKVIRAIGDPSARFKEDALRLLRAVRFTTNLGFSLEAKTAEAIKARARLITRVSAERVRDELTLMIKGPKPAKALRMLSELQLLIHVLPEIEAMKGVGQSEIFHPEGDVWEHTLKMMECLSKQNRDITLTLAWASLLHDVGKPVAASRSEGKNFNGHEKDGGKLSETIGTRLKMSRSEIDRIIALVENHLKFKDVFGMREATLIRFISQPEFEELLALHKADSVASDGNLAYYDFCLARLAELKRQSNQKPKRLITGEDLIQLGLEPGPKFTEILRNIEDLALEQKLNSKEEALEYVIKHYVK